MTLVGTSLWLQLLPQLPDLLPSLEKLSLSRLFTEDSRGNKKLMLFPGLEGDSALPGVGDMGLELYHGKYRLKWHVMGVTYSGRNARRVLEYIARAAVQV